MLSCSSLEEAEVYQPLFDPSILCSQTQIQLHMASFPQGFKIPGSCICHKGICLGKHGIQALLGFIYNRAKSVQSGRLNYHT